jgi:Flp pilus assembly protein TadG
VSRDRGAADALGLVLLAPAMVGLAVMVVALGRSVDARAEVRNVAEAAAQASALERSADAGEAAARRVAESMLAGACTAVAVEHAWVPTGERWQARVRITCEMSNSGLELVRSDAGTGAAEAFAAIDPYRAAP